MLRPICVVICIPWLGLSLRCTLGKGRDTLNWNWEIGRIIEDSGFWLSTRYVTLWRHCFLNNPVLSAHKIKSSVMRDLISERPLVKKALLCKILGEWKHLSFFVLFKTIYFPTTFNMIIFTLGTTLCNTNLRHIINVCKSLLLLINLFIVLICLFSEDAESLKWQKSFIWAPITKLQQIVLFLIQLVAKLNL